MEKLKQGIWDIAFLKKNGERREMKCTADLQIVPKAFHPKTQIQRSGVFCVFDLDKNEWRSFRSDSLLTCTKSS